MARRKRVETVGAARADAASDARYEQLMKEIEQKFGPGTVIRLGELTAEYPHLETGILSLDEATGIGGLPAGRIVEIFGPEAAGKTMLSLQCIAQTQKHGGRCAFIDVEQSMNASFASLLGVDLASLTFSQPQSGEQALDIMISLIESGLFSLIVVDSVAALLPQAEIDGDMQDLQVGAQARMMSKVLRRCGPILNQMGTTVIFINQLREKIGISFGSPEITPGGRALKFYASLRLDVRRREPVREGADIIGSVISARVAKNKVAAPFREAEFELLFDSGISMEDQILTKGLDLGLIQKSGSWYSIDGEKIGQGKDGAKAWLRQNEDAATSLEQKIRSLLGLSDSLTVDRDHDPDREEEMSERL